MQVRELHLKLIDLHPLTDQHDLAIVVRLPRYLIDVLLKLAAQEAIKLGELTHLHQLAHALLLPGLPFTVKARESEVIGVSIHSHELPRL
jgi:hypothetical protein